MAAPIISAALDCFIPPKITGKTDPNVLKSDRFMTSFNEASILLFPAPTEIHGSVRSENNCFASSFQQAALLEAFAGL